ncbi:hypothetical protein BGZ94_006710 [Podila epigama]|nr:hypothetical protein BGZ94_006710 [Podila epigama]
MSSTPPSPHSPPHVVAQWLCGEYPPWLVLHMLLKKHPQYFSTNIIEELLSPLEPSPLPSVHSQPRRTTGHSSLRARLSRHLVQRVHYGYYGSSRDLSPNAVRYLTARARLEYGYFVIWGRAFWCITQEDTQDSSRSQVVGRVNDKKQGKKTIEVER